LVAVVQLAVWEESALELEWEVAVVAINIAPLLLTPSRCIRQSIPLGISTVRLQPDRVGIEGLAALAQTVVEGIPVALVQHILAVRRQVRAPHGRRGTL
jgi:hypothetical protein